MNKNTNKLKKIAIIMLFILIIAISEYFTKGEEKQTENIIDNNKNSYETFKIPEYSGEAYIEINNNIPKFTKEDMELEKDYYSELENGKARNGDDKN